MAENGLNNVVPITQKHSVFQVVLPTVHASFFPHKKQEKNLPYTYLHMDWCKNLIG